MTEAQSQAIKWLADRGGDGVFDKNGILLAAGETAPHTRSTWNQLAKMGLVEIYKPKARGRGRCRIIESRSERTKVNPTSDTEQEGGRGRRFE